MKLPLSFSLKNRDATTAKDARVLNGYVEVKGDPKKGGSVRTLKRPALDSAYTLTAGTGQGLYVRSDPTGSGEPGVVIGDILTRAPTPLTKSMRFTVQPSNVALNASITPAVQVTAYNAIGAVASGFVGTIALVMGTNATGATLGGTVSQPAVSGVATFNDLQLNRSGSGFTLAAASSGLRGVVSSSFDITTTLVFTVQPADSVAGQLMNPAEVTARDSASVTDTNYTGNVTISIYSGSGTLTGTLTVPAVAGVASFANLTMDTVGTFSFQAVGEPVSTANTPSRETSNSFLVSNYSLTAGTETLLGQTMFGYSNTPLIWPNLVGSISPASYNGATIRAYASNPGLPATAFAVSGNVAQTFFTSITGNSVTLLSAAATGFLYDPTTDTTTWLWGTSGTFNATGTFPVVVV